MAVEELGTEIPPGAVVVHEPHGFVKMEDYCGNDLMVINAARVSFRKRSRYQYKVDSEIFEKIESAFSYLEKNFSDDEDEPQPPIHDILTKDDDAVLRFLMREKHGTPFEMCWFLFHVRAPIFVFREWHRHRIASINEESGRYVQLRSDFYLPDDEHVRVQKGRPGRYYFEKAEDPMMASECRALLTEAYHVAYLNYSKMLAKGIAKEIARACLPVGIYSQMYWAVNARSLMNFLSLRNSDRALAEIRDYAAAIEDLWAKRMPVTHSAFVENGRVSP